MTLQPSDEPPLTQLRAFDTHRLVPSAYLPGGVSVLTRIADDDAHLAQLFELDDATNDRLLAEHGLLPGITIHELVFGVPYYRIVNAAFTHAHPFGSRFNGPDRGAWYAGFSLATAVAEVVFHKTVQLHEIQRYDDDATYDDYLADFAGAFHDLRHQPAFRPCLDPVSYETSQALAAQLLDGGSAGVVYPSVRDAGGTCLAAFRPALVANVRRGQACRMTWHGSPTPTISPWQPDIGRR